MGDIIKQFSYRQLKVDNSDDAEQICAALHQDVRILYLEGNTFGIEASERLAKSLAKLPKLEEAHFKDMFTTRGKDEVPHSLTYLTNGIMSSGARLRYLDMSDNAFGPIGMSGLIKYILSDAALELEEIYLSNCGLGPQGSTTLSAALGRLKNLRVIEIGRNRLEADGSDAVCGALSELSQLERIVMFQNGINSKGWKQAGEAIASNKDTLKYLDFFDNCVKADGSLALASGLSQTTRLEEINLSDCMLGAEGFLIILKSLSKSKSLKTLKNLKFEGNEIGGQESAQLICDLFEDRRDDENFVLNLLENEFSDQELEMIRSTLGPRASLTMDEDEEKDGDEREYGDEDEEEDGFELYDAEEVDGNEEDGVEDNENELFKIQKDNKKLKQFQETCQEFVNLVLTNQKLSAKSCLQQLGNLSQKNCSFLEAGILSTELGLMKDEKTRKKKQVSLAVLQFLAQQENKNIMNPNYCRVLQALLSSQNDLSLKLMSNKFIVQSQ